jgi:hypothetical protein
MKRQLTDRIVLCDSDSTPEQDLNLANLDTRDRRRGYFKCRHHFVIKRDGEIEHGHRHHSEPTVGLGRYNLSGVSVCLVGGRAEPALAFTRPQLASLKDLLAELQDEYPDARIIYHHEVDDTVANRGLDLVALAKDLI